MILLDHSPMRFSRFPRIGNLSCDEIRRTLDVLYRREAALLDAIANGRPATDLRTAFMRGPALRWPRHGHGSGQTIWTPTVPLPTRSCACRRPTRPACCAGCQRRPRSADPSFFTTLHKGLIMKKSLLLVLLAACSDPPDPPPPPATPDGLPQLPSVTIDDLQQVPGMPRDENGNIILLEVAGGPITFGAPRNDAISAAARCRDLLASCVGATKDADGCVAKLPICTSDKPWEESAACCPQACVAAYQEERRLGADVLRSAKAVFASDHECFPGLQELYRAAGGTPYLAPRLAPR